MTAPTKKPKRPKPPKLPAEDWTETTRADALADYKARSMLEEGRAAVDLLHKERVESFTFERGELIEYSQHFETQKIH